jgi:SPW repeat
MLSDDWLFWALFAAIVVAAALGSGRYRALAAAARRLAVRRGLVDPGAGRHVDTGPGGFASDLSWISILLGIWVILSPWIWGYDEVEGAVATDVITGSIVVAVTLIGIVLPSVSALNVLAGTWLVLAPWLVGYGSHDGPVGLSDALAGVAIAALAVAALTSATRRIGPATGGPIGRVRRRG